MLSIRTAIEKDIPLIQELSRVIWPAAYSLILSSEQISYMLEMMYSNKALSTQMNELNHHFLLCYDGNMPVGFASFSRSEGDSFKLHKIYVMPNQQGKGVGKYLIDQIVSLILPQGAIALELNVNRYNPAKGFYEKLGFDVVRMEDISIGNGFWMNDYVMRKTL